MKQNEFPLSAVAEIKLSYHPHFKANERPKISEPKQCYKIFMDNWDLGLIEIQEQFKIMLLNRANRVIGISEISKGGIDGAVVDARLIFAIALKAGACSIVLVHNHPSGNLTPSKHDLNLTKRICECGKLLQIDIHDHLIISVDGYLSMAKEGLM
ncbi:RadC family protein [Pedobacter lithocola]|uniref:RadC family protein n=1 Tax=Pedobacter lithocola TaxID=1908239 RepID=A0ABV8PI82_9SPHI